ncbi:MAG: hypothetical protein VB096_09370 [Pseudoflavonifractor sp.]|nr:hypothetical protein [Pseudoflavonifractor sp.]
MKSGFRKILVSVLALTICVSFMLPAYAASPEAETKAVALKQLGLFMGVSETDFALDREPTRVEAIVMLLRALGLEAEAKATKAVHPFTDVPVWADRYVAYAYEKGLTKGVSSTSFGTGSADSNMYLAFMLRALGYNDTNGDFVWNAPDTLAKAVGILPDSVDTEKFMRSDVVLISWAALEAGLKGGAQRLAKKLMAGGVFTGDDYGKAIELVGEVKPAAVTVATLDALKTALTNKAATSIAVDCQGTPLVVTGELTIPYGVTVTVCRGNDFYVEGTLNNNGILKIMGADSYSNDFINYSVMAVQKGGKVLNNGQVILCPSEIGDTEDRGPVGGQLRIFDGSFENNGSVFLKAGSVNTHGGMLAVIEGTFTNNATVIADGFQIDIAGSFINNKGAVIINNSYISTAKGGTFSNSGVLTGFAIVE